MRTKTLFSLLVLCGSTAALANVTASPLGQATPNNTIENNTTAPDAATPAPNDTAPANTTDDSPPN